MVKQDLIKAFKGPFTTKKETCEVLGYSSTQSVKRFFDGLECIGSRYLTREVVDNIWEERSRDEI